MHELDVLTLAWQARQRRAVTPLVLLLQAFLNVHRDPQRPPVPYADVMGWCGYAVPAEAPPVPEAPSLEEVVARLQQVAQTQNAVHAAQHPDGDGRSQGRGS